MKITKKFSLGCVRYFIRSVLEISIDSLGAEQDRLSFDFTDRWEQMKFVPTRLMKFMTGTLVFPGARLCRSLAPGKPIQLGFSRSTHVQIRRSNN